MDVTFIPYSRNLGRVLTEGIMAAGMAAGIGVIADTVKGNGYKSWRYTSLALEAFGWASFGSQFLQASYLDGGSLAKLPDGSWGRNAWEDAFTVGLFSNVVQNLTIAAGLLGELIIFGGPALGGSASAEERLKIALKDAISNIGAAAVTFIPLIAADATLMSRLPGLRHMSPGLKRELLQEITGIFGAEQITSAVHSAIDAIADQIADAIVDKAVG